MRDEVTQRQNERMEQLRQDFKITESDREIRFSAFHERQVSVLAEVYRRLAVAAREQQLPLTGAGPVDRNAQSGARHAINDVDRFVNENEVFIPDELGRSFRGRTEV